MNCSPMVLCTICARGGSKGVRNKNIRPLLGRPLIEYSVEVALISGLFAHVVVSTDSDDIAHVAETAGAAVFFRRPAELATDTAAKLPVIRHALEASEKHYNTVFSAIMDLDSTSPLRSVADIKDSFAQFVRDDNDNLITAMPARRSPYFNLVEINGQGKVELAKTIATPIVRRQDAPKCYDMNASIYIWKRDVLLDGFGLFREKTGLYVMPAERSIDIDSEVDFKLVELLMKERFADAE